MKNLTLVIPAKKEERSLPIVLKEIKDYDCSIIVVLEESDKETIEAIKDFDCRVIFQNGFGYGNAIIQGINNVQTDYLCIFNADGSFDPKYLDSMLNLCDNQDYVFTSRYLREGRSDDDTILTKVGNFIFSTLGKILFSLKLSDILYTFILGKTKSFQSLNLDIPSHERRRIAGFKKVSEFRDGLKILLAMIKYYLRFK